MTIDEFKSGLLPGNYFLTKSMELSRESSCGTLWYTKKFLVYYNRIFLSSNIVSREDANAIADNFEQYVASLPAVQQADARQFFFNDGRPFADPRDPQFRLFDAFKGIVNYNDAAERRQFESLCRKFYFAFLMGAGGQSGVNKHIKDAMDRAGFSMSQIDRIIDAYYAGSAPTRPYSGIKNDYHAFLRNERQVLFYYGFFHSRSSGGSDEEFSSLTPIGRLAIEANYYELQAIWEHQKVKMVSQPVVEDIQNIGGLTVDAARFTVNHNPYLTILRWLLARQTMTKEEYMGIVSRLSEPVGDVQQVTDLAGELAEVDRIIRGFGRVADVNTEDFTKELKKYLMGLRSDFRRDHGQNLMGLCQMDRRTTTTVTDTARLRLLIDGYTAMARYKEQRYGELFSGCERELRQLYQARLGGGDYVVDEHVKMEWDIYNIHVEKPVMLCVMQLMAQMQGVRAESTFILEKMPRLARHMGYGGQERLRAALAQLQQAMQNDNYDAFADTENLDDSLRVQTVQNASAQDLLRRMKTLSAEQDRQENGVRVRNMVLVNLMKSYYSATRQPAAMFCECCGQPTFQTERGEAYLEYHHLIPFSKYEGPDHYLNIYALCPDCHRRFHHLVARARPTLYQHLMAHNYQGRGLVERLRQMHQEHRLTSYGLEFLLVERAITQAEYREVLR